MTCRRSAASRNAQPSNTRPRNTGRGMRGPLQAALFAALGSGNLRVGTPEGDVVSAEVLPFTNDPAAWPRVQIGASSETFQGGAGADIREITLEITVADRSEDGYGDFVKVNAISDHIRGPLHDSRPPIEGGRSPIAPISPG